MPPLLVNINDDFEKIKDNIKKNLIINDDLKRINKNIILCYPSDSTGCGHIRFIFPFTYINSVFGKEGKLVPFLSPYFVRQPDVLLKTRAIYFQRQMTDEQKQMIISHKQDQEKFKFKLIYDIDDLIWGKNETQGGTKYEGIPSYNFAADRISFSIKQNVIDIMGLMDIVTVSTEYLANYIKNVLKVTTPIKVIPNTVPMYLYGKNRRPEVKEKIVKPKVIYPQSPTHYSNTKKVRGDLENSWSEYLIDAVQNDKIELVVMGGLPWMLEGVKDKIKIVPWINAYQYTTLLKSLNAHFILMPLVPNEFNSSKSDIKYIESCAVGAIGIGTCFTDGRPSPYDNNIVNLPDNCSVLDIQYTIDKYCEPENFNSVINKQYDQLEKEKRYLEHPHNINLLTSIF